MANDSPTTTRGTFLGGDPTYARRGVTITKVAVDPEMSNNCYLLRCRRTDEQVLIDAAAEPDRLRELVGAGRLTQGGHHAPALGPPPALADVVGRHRSGTASPERTTRPRSATRPASRGATVRTATRSRRRLHARGDPPRRAHPRLDRAALRRPRGHPHLWTGDCLFPGGVGNTFEDAGALRRRWSTRSRPSSSTGSPTRPGSTPATGTTPPSAPSVRTSPSGASAAGDLTTSARLDASPAASSCRLDA